MAGDADDKRCHCEHVAEMHHDWKRMTWAVGIIFVAVMGVLVKFVSDASSRRVADAPPPIRSGERLFLDRALPPQ